MISDGEGARLRRKRLVGDQEKLDRAVAILGSRSESAAIGEALDAVLLGDELNAGIDRLAAAGGDRELLRRPSGMSKIGVEFSVRIDRRGAAQ